MSMLGPFDRPLALFLRETRRRWAPRWTVAPPVPPEPASGRSLTNRPTLDRVLFLTNALLAPAAKLEPIVAQVEAAVDEQVVAWSPSMYTTSRTELITALLERDDAVAAIDVSVVGQCIGPDRAFVQWRAVGRFENVAFLDDDVLIEPSNRVVESAGVFVFAFAGSLVNRIECYHDALSLLEQVLPGDSMSLDA